MIRRLACSRFRSCARDSLASERRLPIEHSAVASWIQVDVIVRASAISHVRGMAMVSGLVFSIPASLRSGDQSADVRNREIEFLCQCAHRDAALAIGHAQCLGSVGATLQAIAQGAGGFALRFRHLDHGHWSACATKPAATGLRST